MKKQVITVDSSISIRDATKIMNDASVGCVVVMENKLVGIVTTTDLTRLCSVGSDSEMRRVVDQILLRLKPK